VAAHAAMERPGMAETIDNGKPVSDRPQRAPFPGVRLLYAFAFAIIAWLVIHLVFAVAVVQFVVIAVTGRVNDELKSFSFSLVQYLWELLAFVTFVRDEHPFPIGPFPRHP
jgi:type IV secretory pathway TrbL component